MKLHTPLIILFALMNGIILYMFLLHLPFGSEAFLLSLAYWNKLSPVIEIAALLGALTAISGWLWPNDSTKLEEPAALLARAVRTSGL